MFERRRAEDPFTLHRSPPLGSAGVSPALLTLGGRPIFPRGTGVGQSKIETRGVPNFFCVSCRKGSRFDFAGGPIFSRHTGVRFP